MRYHFADCELDPGAHALRRDGRDVHVEPQVFDLLVLLASAGAELVSYDRIFEEVWKGRIVSDATLAARISAARVAVGDTGRAQAIIRTVARRGLQMAVPVKVDLPGGADAAPAAQIPGGGQVIRYVSSADGLRIACGISGQGPPLVRVGHWLTHLDQDWISPVWRPLLERLGRHHTVYRYDQRGTGMSDRDFAGKGIDEFVDDLVAVADATGAERIPIFTASQGVAIALKFAARYPDRVERLVLYAGYAQGKAAQGTQEADDKAAALLAIIRTGWGKRGSDFMQLFSTLYAPDATPEQRENFIRLQLASATPDGAAKLRGVIDRFDVTEILADVKAPVLLIHASGDRVVPVAQSQLMARVIPGAELVTLDSINHVPLPHDPAWENLMQASERFLASG